MPAAPHLVDPPLGDADAELRLVVNDRDLREVLRPPARAAQPAAEIGLLRVDEELLVEETDLLEGLTADEEHKIVVAARGFKIVAFAPGLPTLKLDSDVGATVAPGLREAADTGDAARPTGDRQRNSVPGPGELRSAF